MAITHKAYAIYLDAMAVACNDLVKNKSLATAKSAFFQEIKNQNIPADNPKHSREQDILNYFEVHGILELQRKSKNMTNSVHKEIHLETQHKMIIKDYILDTPSTVSVSSEHVESSLPQSEAMIADNSMSKKKPVFKFDQSVSCLICHSKFSTTKAFYKHYKKKHSQPAIKKLESREQHRLANVASIDAELKKHRNKEEIREALRKQLAPSPLDDIPTYNAEAYRIALRTMTQGEAYSLAKDSARSVAFIEKFNQSLASAPETHSSQDTASMIHVTKVSEDDTDHYKPTKIGDNLVRRAKEERMQRDAFKKQVLQEDVEEKALFSERTVKTRINQAEFAKRVASNFSNQCCITGSSEPLEAAHIEPLSMGDNNNTSNGLLLIACLHRLLDSGKMAINPDTLTVHFSDNCTWFGAKTFDGRIIAKPLTPLNITGLKRLWDSFRTNHM